MAITAMCYCHNLHVIVYSHISSVKLLSVHYMKLYSDFFKCSSINQKKDVSISKLAIRSEQAILAPLSDYYRTNNCNHSSVMLSGIIFPIPDSLAECRC